MRAQSIAGVLWVAACNGAAPAPSAPPVHERGPERAPDAAPVAVAVDAAPAAPPPPLICTGVISERDQCDCLAMKAAWDMGVEDNDDGEDDDPRVPGVCAPVGDMVEGHQIWRAGYSDSDDDEHGLWLVATRDGGVEAVSELATGVGLHRRRWIEASVVKLEARKVGARGYLWVEVRTLDHDEENAAYVTETIVSEVTLVSLTPTTHEAPRFPRTFAREITEDDKVRRESFELTPTIKETTVAFRRKGKAHDAAKPFVGKPIPW